MGCFSSKFISIDTISISDDPFEKQNHPECVKPSPPTTIPSSKTFSFQGENSVVLYTTSLRGIRKTYEDCKLVRSVLQSYNISFSEKDVSMDLGFREELRKLMGGMEETKIPVLFVKGRMVGGVEEVLKLEEERKLNFLMKGIPTATVECDECGGMRFVVCKECFGVLDEKKKKKKKKKMEKEKKKKKCSLVFCCFSCSF